MTSRVHMSMNGQQPVVGADPHGLSNSRPGPGFRSAPSNPDDPVERLRAFAAQVEDAVDEYAQPLRPHLPAIGRFLIIITFLEDAWRLLVDWSEQNHYLQEYRGFPWGLSHIFLLVNMVTMLACSGAVVTQRYTEPAVGGLLGVVIIQGIGYGLFLSLAYLLRNLSVVGGLLMVFSDSMVNRKQGFAGLPTISENDRKKYFLLAGRVLLIFLFIGYIFQGEWSFFRVLFSLLGMATCGMVAVGFKAKWFATFLVLVLSVFNVFANNWWAPHHEETERDFLKYDFFQTLSIVGGLILLVKMGPGGLSVDEKKKNY